MPAPVLALEQKSYNTSKESSQHDKCKVVINGTISTMWQEACYFHVCVRKYYFPEMSHMSHMYRLVHVYIWDNYVSTYTSYEHNKINNLTRNTYMHTFHIIGICLWRNMTSKSHIYGPLHYYHGLHIDSTLLHIQVQKQKKLHLIFTTLLPYMC